MHIVIQIMYFLLCCMNTLRNKVDMTSFPSEISLKWILERLLVLWRILVRCEQMAGAASVALPPGGIGGGHVGGVGVEASLFCLALGLLSRSDRNAFLLHCVPAVTSFSLGCSFGSLAFPIRRERQDQAHDRCCRQEQYKTDGGRHRSPMLSDKFVQPIAC